MPAIHPQDGPISDFVILTVKFMPHIWRMDIAIHVLRQVSGSPAQVGQGHLHREQVMLPFLPDPLMMDRVFARSEVLPLVEIGCVHCVLLSC